MSVDDSPNNACDHRAGLFAVQPRDRRLESDVAGIWCGASATTTGLATADADWRRLRCATCGRAARRAKLPAGRLVRSPGRLLGNGPAAAARPRGSSSSDELPIRPSDGYRAASRTSLPHRERAPLRATRPDRTNPSIRVQESSSTSTGPAERGAALIHCWLDRTCLPPSAAGDPSRGQPRARNAGARWYASRPTCLAG